MPRTKQGDTHVNKMSHMSTPISDATEFHLSADSLEGAEVEDGGKYMVCFPVICTSYDADDCRFKQIGKPELVAFEDFDDDKDQKLKKFAKRAFKAKGEY